ncbi:unnamed protein product [Alternaria alternata]
MDLPVAIPEIAKAADEERSNELLLESLGFSIMSRNLYQVGQVLRQLNNKDIDPSPLYPFHLATSFLDGSKSCCDVVYELAHWDHSITGAQIHKTYLNEYGHTILDNLMITIIKAHTSAKPVVVDENLKDVARFVGEEVDICGRWDADSPCIRRLYAHGPTQGRDGEDLFGILACALCFIFHGFNPSVRADVSVAALLSLDSFVECDHVELTAAKLAKEIMAMPAFGIWNTKLRTGWIVLTGILRRCEAVHVVWARKENLNPELHGSNDPMRLTKPNDEDKIIGSTEPDDMLRYIHLHDPYPPCFTGEKNVGTLWSSVQAEFLSYRRLNEGLGWTSQYFSMETLQEQLEKDQDLISGYVKHNLLKAHCACHSFGRWPLAPLLSDAMDPDLANLDVRGRATYGELLEDS